MGRKTQWTTEVLESLIQINNHRIMFDGCEYLWVRMFEDKWVRGIGSNPIFST